MSCVVEVSRCLARKALHFGNSGIGPDQDALRLCTIFRDCVCRAVKEYDMRSLVFSWIMMGLIGSSRCLDGCLIRSS